MNIPDGAVIWRDSVVIDMLHVGVEEWISSTQRRVRYCFFVAHDTIQEIFGDEAYVRAGKLEPGKPVSLASVLEGEDSAA